MLAENLQQVNANIEKKPVLLFPVTQVKSHWWQ